MQHQLSFLSCPLPLREEHSYPVPVLEIRLSISEDQVALLSDRHVVEDREPDEGIEKQEGPIQDQPKDDPDPHLAQDLRMSDLVVDAAIHLMVLPRTEGFLSCCPHS